MKIGDRFSAMPLSASAGDTASPQTCPSVFHRAVIRSASGLLSGHEANGKTENAILLNAEAVGGTENGRLVGEEAIFRTASTILFNEEAIIGTENGLLACEEGVCGFNMSLDFSRMDYFYGKLSKTVRFCHPTIPVPVCQLLTTNT